MKRTSTGSSSSGERAERLRPAPPSSRVPSSASEVQWCLDQLGVEPHRSRGQNFLVDPAIARAEAALVDLAPGSSVVEIGGGLGLLTSALVERGFAPLTVLEKEPKFVAFLATAFADRVKVVEADALTSPLPPADAYVGNLPFSTATPIIDRVLSSGVEHGVFLVQKEVADRLTSHPGERDYGRLRIMTALAGGFVDGPRVPSRAFFPEPKVDGALVIFSRDPPEVPVRDRSVLEALLGAAFTSRRKMLGGTLPSSLRELTGDPEVDVDSLLDGATWPSDWKRRRAEEIPPMAYFALANELARVRSRR